MLRSYLTSHGLPRSIWTVRAVLSGQLIDGEKTVADIAVLVKEQFGEAAEPLYPRIVKYFQIVESYHFIKFNNKTSK